VENGMIDIGGFTFTPEQTNDVLQKRLSTNPPKKK